MSVAVNVGHVADGHAVQGARVCDTQLMSVADTECGLHDAASSECACKGWLHIRDVAVHARLLHRSQTRGWRKQLLPSIHATLYKASPHL